MKGDDNILTWEVLLLGVDDLNVNSSYSNNSGKTQTWKEHVMNTKEFDKHKKSKDEMHKCRDTHVSPPLNYPNSWIYSPTFTTWGGVTTEGEEMEVANGIVNSGDNGLNEHMSVRQETHLLDKSADRDNTMQADRTYQATYPWCGIVREDVGTNQDTHAPSSH